VKPSETDDPGSRAVREVAAALAHVQESAGCPAPEDLAGFAEGLLDRRRRERVEAHLAACSDCRGVVSTLLQAGPAEAVRRRQVPVRWWLAAALLLVGLGAMLWPRGGSPVRTLTVAAADLRRTVPDLFGDFAPLDDGELAARPPAVRDADSVRWIHPSANGLIRDGRPRLVLAAEGLSGRSFRLEVEQAVDGTPFGAADGELAPSGGSGDRLAADWPVAAALPPGQSFALRLVVATATGQRTLERIVTTAPAAAVTKYYAAARAIADRHPGDLGALLRAHLALRARFLADAETAAADFRARRPAEPAATPLQRHVAAWLGLPEPE
jgi:hypothetical protein